MDESEEEVEPEEPETNPQFEELVDISKYSPTKPPLGQAKVKYTKLFLHFSRDSTFMPRSTHG